MSAATNLFVLEDLTYQEMNAYLTDSAYIISTLPMWPSFLKVRNPIIMDNSLF